MKRAQASAAASVTRTRSSPTWRSTALAGLRPRQGGGVDLLPVVHRIGPLVQADTTGGFGVGVDVLDVGAAAGSIGVVHLLVDDERARRADQLHAALGALPDDRLGDGMRLLVLGFVEFEVPEVLVEAAEHLFPALVVHERPSIDLRTQPPIVPQLMARTEIAPLDSGFQGRSALVVGRSRGLGRAGALALAREGCRVLAVGRSAAALAQLRQTAAARGLRLRTARGDA